MKITGLVLIFTVVLMKINAVAQQIEIPVFTKVKSESIINQKQILKLNLPHQPEIMSSCMIIRKPFRQYELKSLPSSVCYAAFFCRMEMQVHNHFNIWIKLRAGNFDDYEKGFLETK